MASKRAAIPRTLPDAGRAVTTTEATVVAAAAAIAAAPLGNANADTEVDAALALGAEGNAVAAAADAVCGEVNAGGDDEGDRFFRKFGSWRFASHPPFSRQQAAHINPFVFLHLRGADVLLHFTHG